MNQPSFLPCAAEILESRIAPAALVTFNYTDADGQAVSISANKGTLEQLTAAIESVPAEDGRMQVVALNLGEVYRGADITIITGLDPEDGLATKIGFINAAGVDLGRVRIDGDISRINAGDEVSATPALRLLTVGSWGKFDVTAGETPGEFDSTVIGGIKALKVKGDFEGAWLHVRGSDSSSPNFTDRHGRIGDLEIDGSLLGSARANGGHISTTGDIGTVTILGSVKGFAALEPPPEPVLTQHHTGRVSSGGSMGSVTVGTAAAPADLMGGDGFESGQIVSTLGMGALTVHGNIIGGFGEDSGAVGSGGVIGKVTVDKSVIGGPGIRSGAVLSTTGMQAVSIGEDLLGGTGDNSGFIASSVSIRSVAIGGSIVGGAGSHSGSVGSFGPLGAVSVGEDLRGGPGSGSGQIVSATTIKSVDIVRDLVGGSSFESGSIGSLRGLGPISIGGSLFAGSGERSGLISTQQRPVDVISSEVIFDPPIAPIARVTIGGSIVGLAEAPSEGVGSGFEAGSILSSGKLGAVVVTGDLIGGDNSQSGRIASETSIVSILIGGSLIGGDGDRSGVIEARGAIGPVRIGEDLRGGAGEGSGLLGANSLAKVHVGLNLLGGDGGYSGVIETRSSDSNTSPGGNLGPVVIGAAIRGGQVGPGSGQIYSAAKLASVTVGFGENLDGEQFTGVAGGLATGSGVIASRGDMGPVIIHGGLQGNLFSGSGTTGFGDEAGKILSGGKLASLTANYIYGGFGNYDTNTDDPSSRGQVVAHGAIGKVIIEQSLVGNSGRESGQIRGHSIGSVFVGNNVSGSSGQGSGSIVANGHGIGSIFLGGTLSGGSGVRSGWVAAFGNIGSFEAQFVGGNGETFGGPDRPRVSAGYTLQTVTVAISAYGSDFVAGYDPDGNPFNADAQIGKVTLGSFPSSDGQTTGTIYGLNIVAGALTGDRASENDDGVFSTGDDLVIDDPANEPSVYSRIASVIIKGPLISSSTQGDRYGIVAEIIGSLKIGSSTISLTAGPSNDPKSSSGGGLSQDFYFRELRPVSAGAV